MGHRPSSEGQLSPSQQIGTGGHGSLPVTLYAGRLLYQHTSLWHLDSPGGECPKLQACITVNAFSQPQTLTAKCMSEIALERTYHTRQRLHSASAGQLSKSTARGRQALFQQGTPCQVHALSENTRPLAMLQLPMQGCKAHDYYKRFPCTYSQ